MRVAIICAHAGADSLSEAAESWGSPAISPFLVDKAYELGWVRDASLPLFIVDGRRGMLTAYQRGLEASQPYDILAYLHDDVVFREPAEPIYDRILSEFEDESVGLVGFGGALQHGAADLYKTPYQLQQLGRTGYRSNVDDAEVHGERFTGTCDVAVLDGFALIVRRSILQRAGGWPISDLEYINYDYWLSCQAHRQGYRIRLVGARCHHLGGRTAVQVMNHQDNGEHERAHRFIFTQFADVLPWSCASR